MSKTNHSHHPVPAPVSIPSVNLATPIPAPTRMSPAEIPKPPVPKIVGVPNIVGVKTPSSELKLARQVTSETDAIYTIAGEEITRTNALIGMAVICVLSSLLMI